MRTKSNVAISILDPVNATIRINSADETDYSGGSPQTAQGAQDAAASGTGGSGKTRLLRTVDP